MATLLKNLVSASQIKKAGLTGEEEVRDLNLWAKGQQNHNSNDIREIFDSENNQTGYAVKTTAKRKTIIWTLNSKK